MPAKAALTLTAASIKTPEEIVGRIRQILSDGSDFFGFQAFDLISFLPFAEAKEFLKPDVTQEQWTPSDRDNEAITRAILDYMPFAWEKANDCRGLSANRSIEHMKAWLWLLDDELTDDLDGMYEYYGKPCLRVICEKYGWDWKKWDDGCWRNSEGDDGIAPPATV